MAISEQTHGDETGEAVKVWCSACNGTGMRPFENGPRGATWTDYERCPICKGRGYFMRQ